MRLLLCFVLCLNALTSFAQQAIWVTATDSGDLYCLDPENCNIRLKCNTGKIFMDIAFTPDGRLWGNTPDTLYEIDTSDCSIRAIGHIPPSKSLVGLNDSTLLLDSLRDLYSVNTTTAAKQLIGHIGRPLDGDLTWIGRDLYARGVYLIKMVLDSSYTTLLSVDTIVNATNAYYYFTPAFATMLSEGNDTVIVAIPGTSIDHVFTLDPQDASYQTLCILEEVKNAYGATCMIFPPDPPAVVSIGETGMPEERWHLYPNPVADKVYLELPWSESKTSAITLRLFDHTGRLLMQESGKKEIGLEKYPEGLYLLQLLYGQKNIGWKKLVKQ